MASPQGSVTFYVPAYSAATLISVGNLVMPISGTDGWVVATAASRGTTRCSGLSVAITNGSGFGTVEIWQGGSIDPSITGLGTGAASWVRCSATGVPERFTPALAGTSDVIGYCETDGRLHLLFGVLTEALLFPPIGGPSKTCTMEQFGAFGDGTTDDSSALTAALAAVTAGTYSGVAFGGRSYYLPSTFLIPNGCSLTGRGDSTVLYTTANAPLLRSANNAEDINVSGLKLLGNLAGTSQSGLLFGQDGVAGTGIGRVRADRITVENMGGTGIGFSRAAQSALLFYGPQLSNFRVRNCGLYGLLVTQQAEYIKAVNGDVRDCGYGAWVGAGNFSGHAINFTANQTGFHLEPGTNDAHGQLVGCNINHNSLHYGTTTYNAVEVGAITQGFTFTGCNVYQGGISVNGNASIVQFEGGEMDITTITNTNGKLRFVGSTFPMAYFASCAETGTGWTEFA